MPARPQRSRRPWPDRPPFPSDVELAEAATLAVRLNLAFDEPHLATILQPVACAAWGLVAGAAGREALRAEALRAQDRLRLACFATDERRLLGRVLAHVDACGRR